jgi:hypothetical protein
MEYLASCDIERRANWCAAFVRFNMDRAGSIFPTIRSAVAQHYNIKGVSIKATDVLAKKKEIPRGWLVIWKRGNTWQGHIAFTTKLWRGKRGNTIEGNTTTTVTGNQRAGGYVARKVRDIEPYNYFRIIAFTRVEDAPYQANILSDCDDSHHVELSTTYR